ncbi:hypothetical protein ABW21_db0202925 [Orbilia brochopaga]|nr:hypothetical protein ABW21_db0202925 [Drechslerella brochopaga]
MQQAERYGSEEEAAVAAGEVEEEEEAEEEAEAGERMAVTIKAPMQQQQVRSAASNLVRFTAGIWKHRARTAVAGLPRNPLLEQRRPQLHRFGILLAKSVGAQPASPRPIANLPPAGTKTNDEGTSYTIVSKTQ